MNKRDVLMGCAGAVLFPIIVAVAIILLVLFSNWIRPATSAYIDTVGGWLNVHGFGAEGYLFAGALPCLVVPFGIIGFLVGVSKRGMAGK